MSDPEDEFFEIGEEGFQEKLKNAREEANLMAQNKRENDQTFFIRAIHKIGNEKFCV